MSGNFDPSRLKQKKSRSILVMSTLVTSISWFRKGSIRTVPISSARRSGTKAVARKYGQLYLGLRNYSREDLEAVQRAGEMLRINVLGLASISQDVTPELARATIASVSVLGALHASPAVKAALADRMR